VYSSLSDPLLKNAFGTANDLTTDYNLDNVTNSIDFSILKGNFAVSGAALTCP
jgi:hypothetical protein